MWFPILAILNNFQLQQAFTECILRNLNANPNQPLSQITTVCEADASITCTTTRNTILFWTFTTNCHHKRRLTELDEETLMNIEREKLFDLLQMHPRPPSPPTLPPPSSPPTIPSNPRKVDIADQETQLALIGTLGGVMCAFGCFLSSICFFLRRRRHQIESGSTTVSPRTPTASPRWKV